MNRPLGFYKLFGALRVAQFRWIWSSSVFASLVQTLGLLTTGWLVLEVTDSAFWVGASAGITGLGQLAFGVFGGVLADRIDRRYALIAFQCFTGLLFLALGILVLQDLASIPVIFVILFLRGMTVAGILPFSNALTFDVVGRNLILNAMAARLTAMNLSRIIGGIVGGVLIGVLGTGLTLIRISAIAVLGSIPLMFIRKQRENIKPKETLFRMARAGVVYALQTKTLRSLLLLSVLMEM
ncbi:MFS transporter, partial [SAR202 cluster bacterium AD-802-E10_MRT_200m]|nr:MFS transporter [SAR202 cluster bacterium AD-802-E10_MRT_200m]